MKRFISGFWCIVILLCAVLFIPTKAEATTSGATGSCTWSLNGTVLTISGSGNMGSYYFYPTLNYTNAPWGNEITHVIIENGVTNVGQYAFYGCKKLQSVTIPSSVKQIDTQAFRRTGLVSIVIPEGVKTIQDAAFEQCTALVSVTLPSSLTHIGNYAFQSCKMTSIVFSTNLKQIGTSAFNYCRVTDVWYLGNKNDKAGMTIGGFNACLNTATWHYDSCPIGAAHSYDNDCDATCNGCGIVRIVPAHIYDNVCDTTCNVCGNNRSVEHQYDDACDTKCNICQEERAVLHFYDDGRVTQNATCNVIGIKTFTCKECGATKIEEIAKTSDHQYGNWIKFSDTQHKRICVACTKEEIVDHHWNEGKTTEQPTCKEPGIKTYTCTDCSAIKAENIEKLTTHTFDYACDTECNICGVTRITTHSYKDSWDMDEINHWYECSVCQYKKEVAAHTLDNSTRTCSICSYVITQDVDEPDDPSVPSTEGADVPTDSDNAPTKGTDTPTNEGDTPTKGNDPQNNKNKSGLLWWIIILIVVGFSIAVAFIFAKKRNTGMD